MMKQFSSFFCFLFTPPVVTVSSRLCSVTTRDHFAGSQQPLAAWVLQCRCDMMSSPAMVQLLRGFKYLQIIDMGWHGLVSTWACTPGPRICSFGKECDGNPLDFGVSYSQTQVIAIGTGWDDDLNGFQWLSHYLRVVNSQFQGTWGFRALRQTSTCRPECQSSMSEV